MTETINALVPVLAYQQSRAHIFPSEESARWQFRKHKATLVEAGALFILAGRHMVLPERADAVFLNIGTCSAQRAAA